MGLVVSERQLNLFRSKRQRGRIPPSPTEFAMQCFLVDVVKRWIVPGWKFTHVPLGEVRDPVTAARLKRLGTEPGWPDLQFAGPGRRMFFLELKRRGGRLSEAQAAMRDHLEGCGFEVLVTDSVDVAIEVLKDAGILQKRFGVQ